MKRPVTSLCRRPGKKTARRQSVPDAGTISAHRDALRRAGGTAGQKPPGRQRKNSPRRGPETVCKLRPRENGEQWGVWCREASHWAARRGRGHAWAQKTAPGGDRGLCTGCAHGRTASNKGAWYREVTARAARQDRGHTRRKNSPRRRPEAVWMRDMGVTCPGRSV